MQDSIRALAEELANDLARLSSSATLSLATSVVMPTSRQQIDISQFHIDSPILEVGSWFLQLR